MGFTVRFVLGLCIVLITCCGPGFSSLQAAATSESPIESLPGDKIIPTEVAVPLQNNDNTLTQPQNEQITTKPKTDDDASNTTATQEQLNKVDDLVQNDDKTENGTAVKSDEDEKTGRARSMSINKYVSKEFHNFNNVYTLPISPDTEKYINPDFEFHSTTTYHHAATDLEHEESSHPHSFDSELTTPKTALFDSRYKAAVDSVDQTLEHIDESAEQQSTETHDRVEDTVDTLYDRAHRNGTKAALNFINFTNIVSNDNNSKTSVHKDLDIEAGSNLEFSSSYNDTKIIGDDDNGTAATSMPALETKQVPIGDDGNGTTTKNAPVLEAKKVLTKPQVDKNNSDLLSNKIETDGANKGVEVAYASTTPAPVGTTTKTAEKLNLTNEQLVQENQVIPVHVTPTSTSTSTTIATSTSTSTATTTDRPSPVYEHSTETTTIADSTTTDQTETVTVTESTVSTTITDEPTTIDSTSTSDSTEGTTTWTDPSVIETTTTDQSTAETTTETAAVTNEATTQVPLSTTNQPEPTTIVDTPTAPEKRHKYDFTAEVTTVTSELVRIEQNTPTADYAESNTGTPPGMDGGNNGGTIAAIVISTIGAVCLVLLAGLLFIMKKRQKRFNYGQRCTPVSLDDYSMDNISVYNTSVRRKGQARASKRSHGNPAFEDPASATHPLNFPALGKFASNLDEIRAEFDEVPQITARTNELPDGCDTKNRYANVIPLPETRVFLAAIEGYPTSDYINANYVTGPNNTKGYYIACQAPMQNTVDDFWRMIWEQQCKVVLMVTHLFENGVEKSVDYLPPSEVLDCHRLFGDFQITLKKREVKEKYIISIVQLKNMVSNSWREVTHFWYLGWPEKGVPTEANSLIAFLIEARSYMKSSSLDRKDVTNGNLNGTAKNDVHPVVVHCSPGTGRTGVVIACDYAIREFEKMRLVDIPRIVYKIRRDRANAVQTKDQYAFIYKVIALYATKLTGGTLDIDSL